MHRRRTRSARSVKLVYLGGTVEGYAEHVLSGFVGGMVWGVLVEAESGTELMIGTRLRSMSEINSRETLLAYSTARPSSKRHAD